GRDRSRGGNGRGAVLIAWCVAAALAITLQDGVTMADAASTIGATVAATAAAQDAAPPKAKKPKKKKTPKETEPAPDEPAPEGGDGVDTPGGIRFVWKQHPSIRFGDAVRLDFQAKFQEDFHSSYPGADASAGLETWELHRNRVGIKGNVYKHIEYE